MEIQYCELHSEPLKRGTAAYIHDSCVYSYVEFMRAKKLFPYSNSFKLYGSPIFNTQEKIPASLPVEYCQQCRAAEYEWLFDRLPTSKDILKIVKRYQKEEDLPSEKVQILARVYLKHAQKLELSSQSPNFSIDLVFGKGDEEKQSKAVIHNEDANTGEKIAFENRKVYFINISILAPYHLIDFLYTGAKFRGLAADGDTFLHGEIFKVEGRHNKSEIH